MRALLTSLLALALSVVLTLAVKLDNGYVLIGFQQWSVEGSLALFLIFNLLIFVTLYILLRAFARVWSIPRQLHGWQDHRSQERARREFNRGLVQLSEGEWQNAEKSLVRFATRSEAPLLNYLQQPAPLSSRGRMTGVTTTCGWRTPVCRLPMLRSV